MFVKEDGTIYLQVYEYFRENIIKGFYKANYKLPSKRDFASEYDISVNTVENAYAKLLEEGFIYSLERKGYFVSDVGDLYISEHKEVRYEVEEDDVKYDFSYSTVSKEGFPYRILRKIYNNLEDSQDFLKSVDYQGYMPLRIEIAKYLKESRNFEADPEQIIISSGSEYLFQIIVKLIDGNYAVENPGYKMLRNILEINNINYVSVPVEEDGIDVDVLKKSKADVVSISPAHQFPTGVILSMKKRIEILNWAKDKYIIEDDYDSEFKYSKSPVPALKSIDVNDRVIYIGSFSKSISSSIRVSYMVLPKELLPKYHRIFNCFVCPVSIIMQKILTEFLCTREFEKHLNRMKKIYSRKRQIIVEMVEKRPDIKITGTDSGLHIVLEYNSNYSEEYIINEARKKGIKVYGLSYYGGDKTKSSILLGFAGMEDEDLVKAVSLLLEI